jgi:hypothetical protein
MQFFVLLAGLIMTACGYLGPIQPPALAMPQRVYDLRGAQFGSKITVEFTIPPLTTEGQPLTNVRSVELFTGPIPNPYSAAAFMIGAKKYVVPATGPGPLKHDIPITDWIGKDVTLMVRATGPKGKSSDLSNPATLGIRAPLTTPSDFKAENEPRGIAISWKGAAGEHYHLYRAEGTEGPALVDTVDASPYLDTMVDFGTSYRYFVNGFDGTTLFSDTAESAPVVREDVFPPSVPQGVTGEPGTNTIELSWERNTEPRFQGYNIYRAVGDGDFEKVAGPIVAPSYSDRMVEAGKKYRYQITSVGVNGLESVRSAVAEVMAQ